MRSGEGRGDGSAAALLQTADARPGGVLICLLIVGLVALWTYEPRLHHDFPSMVDDWSAIQNAPDQLRGVLEGGMPEGTRYRPGFVMWNALQWHTLGAPTHFLGPQLWGIARWAV